MGTTLTDLDLTSLVEDVIPFNRLLGVRLVAADPQAGTLVLELPMRPELIGNVTRGMAHGGAVSALIDAAAGAAAALSLPDLRAAPGIATIDMRVDYLEPGRGDRLVAEARVMRAGRRVIVVRVDVSDANGTLVALGTATFGRAGGWQLSDDAAAGSADTPA